MVLRSVFPLDRDPSSFCLRRSGALRIHFKYLSSIGILVSLVAK